MLGDLIEQLNAVLEVVLVTRQQFTLHHVLPIDFSLNNNYQLI